jgi:hypothetical protein
MSVAASARSGTRPAVTNGVIIGAIVFLACAVFAAVRLIASHGEPLPPTTVAAVQTCGAVSGATWRVGDKTGDTWIVATNFADCARPLARAPALTGEGITEIAAIDGYRCAASATDASSVLAGICYTEDGAAYFAWGAATPPYDQPAACATCTGIPGEGHVAPINLPAKE